MNTYKVMAQRELGEWVAEVDVIGATQARRPIRSRRPTKPGHTGAHRPPKRWGEFRHPDKAATAVRKRCLLLSS